MTAAVLAAVSMLAAAAEATLKVGDHAPALQTGKWIQGEPVKEFEKGTVYIVEFWATWCGPCRQSIPHLNETYKRFKDKGLVVIGQDCWERDDALVAPFVEKMGEKMTYRVALDDKSGSERGKMAETWMAAAGQNGIPAAFVVNKQGIIAWIGHPMGLRDEVLEQVFDGTYDLAKAAADFEKQQEAKRKQQAEFEKRNAPLMAIRRAMQKKDWDAALDKAAEAEKVVPEAERYQVDMLRFSILLAKEDYPAAYKVAAGISAAQKDNAGLQNQLAWWIATDKTIKQRDLALAETIAVRADDAAKGQEPAIIDTLARVRFMLGKKEDAIALQEKAIRLAPDEQKDMFQKTLDNYKRGELPKDE
jgi:thiol-disulfide isomerase/thioredoxin